MVQDILKIGALSLTWLACIMLIMVVVAFGAKKKRRRYPSVITLFQFGSIAFTVVAWLLDFTSLYSREAGPVLCTIQGLAINYGVMAAVYWGTVHTYHLNATIVNGKSPNSLRHLMPWYLFLSFGVPLVPTLGLLAMVALDELTFEYRALWCHVGQPPIMRAFGLYVWTFPTLILCPYWGVRVIRRLYQGRQWMLNHEARLQQNVGSSRKVGTTVATAPHASSSSASLGSQERTDSDMAASATDGGGGSPSADAALDAAAGGAPPSPASADPSRRRPSKRRANNALSRAVILRVVGISITYTVTFGLSSVLRLYEAVRGFGASTSVGGVEILGAIQGVIFGLVMITTKDVLDFYRCKKEESSPVAARRSPGSPRAVRMKIVAGDRADA